MIWADILQTPTYSVADPGFPFGGGPPTSNEGAFRQERMRKRKNWVPWKWAALPPQGRIQDFVDPFLRGRGPLTRVLFGENVCENERIGTRRGACAGKFCM